jgi:hypothetical protein
MRALSFRVLLEKLPFLATLPLQFVASSRA